MPEEEKVVVTLTWKDAVVKVAIPTGLIVAILVAVLNKVL